jgi:hypothetical protein
MAGGTAKYAKDEEDGGFETIELNNMKNGTVEVWVKAPSDRLFTPATLKLDPCLVKVYCDRCTVKASVPPGETNIMEGLVYARLQELDSMIPVVSSPTYTWWKAGQFVYPAPIPSGAVPNGSSSTSGGIVYIRRPGRWEPCQGQVCWKNSTTVPLARRRLLEETETEPDTPEDLKVTQDGTGASAKEGSTFESRPPFVGRSRGRASARGHRRSLLPDCNTCPAGYSTEDKVGTALMNGTWETVCKQSKEDICDVCEDDFFSEECEGATVMNILLLGNGTVPWPIPPEYVGWPELEKLPDECKTDFACLDGSMKAQLDNCTSLFLNFDKDKNGFWNHSEFEAFEAKHGAEIMRSMGMNSPTPPGPSSSSSSATAVPPAPVASSSSSSARLTFDDLDLSGGNMIDHNEFDEICKSTLDPEIAIEKCELAPQCERAILGPCVSTASTASASPSSKRLAPPRSACALAKLHTETQRRAHRHAQHSHSLLEINRVLNRLIWMRRSSTRPGRSSVGQATSAIVRFVYLSACLFSVCVCPWACVLSGACMMILLRMQVHDASVRKCKCMLLLS